MKFTKNQIQVLVALNIVVAILFAIVFLIPLINADSTPPTNDTPTIAEPSVTHDKYRLPRIAFNENLYYETNLGGSGNETVENAFLINDELFIVGSTESADLDFDESENKNTYLTILKNNGSVKSYHFFDGILIRSMQMPDDKILLFMDCDTTKKLFVLDLNGSITKETDLKLAKNETVSDIVFDLKDRLNIIISVKIDEPPYMTLKVLLLSRDYEPFDGAVFTYSSAVSYVNAYGYDNGLLITANISETNSSSLLTFKWRNDGKETQTLPALKLNEFSYSAIEILPLYKTGYVSLVVGLDGLPRLLEINNDLTKVNAIMPFFNQQVNGGQIYSDNTFIYVYLLLKSNYSKMFVFDATTLREIEEIEPFEFFTGLDTFASYKTDAYFAGRHTSTQIMSIRAKGGELFELSYATANERVKKIIPCDGYILAVCESTSSSFDVGKNFGGSDIWIVKIKF